MKKRIKTSLRKIKGRFDILSIYILMSRALAKSRNGKYGDAYAIDLKITERLMHLESVLLAGQRSKLVLDLGRYIGNITKTVILERDTIEDNERISLYLELLNQHYFDDKRLSAQAIAYFVESMVLALATEMRRNKAIEVYEKNAHYLSSNQKSKLFVSWMAVIGAKLPISAYINPLLEGYEAQMDEYAGLVRDAMEAKNFSEASKHRAEMISFTNRISAISNMLEIPVKSLDSSIKEIFSLTEKNLTNNLLNLGIALVRQKEHQEAVEQWLDTQQLFREENLRGMDQKKLAYIRQALDDTKNGRRIQSGIISADNFIYEIIKKVEVSVLRSKTKTPSQKIFILEMYLLTLHVLFGFVIQFRMKVTVANQIVKTKKALMYLSSAKKYWSALDLVKPEGKGDILFVHVGLSFGPSAHNSFALLLEAKRRGNMITGIHQNMYMCFDDAHRDILDISKNTMGYGDVRYQKGGPRKFDWSIDPSHKRVEAIGINLYQPIFDRVARWQFSYFMNLEDDAAARHHFRMSVDAYDLVLENCLEYEKWAIKNNCKIRFVSDVSHLYPEAGYMYFCDHYKGAADMKYIQIRPGYEDYFKNKAEAVTETLAGLNMTDNPKARLPVFGTKEMFEKYYAEHTGDIAHWQEKAKQWFGFQRSNVAAEISEEDKLERAKVLKLIEEYKSQGKKVYLASGKLVFDLAVKYTKGCAHDDMCHWITHTVETVKKNPDILLLIKPHPHETRKEITMSSEAVGTIADLVQTELGANTILLKGHWFRNIDIMHYIDVELTWGGTSSLEFQSQGITTLMADECAHDDYPIGFLRVNSLQEYEEFLNHPETFELLEDLPERALMFLAFLGSDDVLLQNRYTTTMGNNYGIHKSKINMDAVKDYAKNGDENLAKFYDRLV